MLALAGLLAAACASSGGGVAPVRPPRIGQTQKGLASWYGHPYHGRRTASGEVYDMNELSAAHRTLPLGTTIEVRNLENGRKVVLRVNDRGPFVRGRIVDLSRQAARELDFERQGLARVEIMVVAGPGEPVRAARPRDRSAADRGTPSSAATGSYWVQVGAFRDEGNARNLAATLEPSYPGAAVRADTGWYRVQLPAGDKKKRAEALRRELERQGYDAVVIALQPRSKR